MSNISYRRNKTRADNGTPRGGRKTLNTKPWHAHYDFDVPTTIRYPRIPLHEILDIPAGAFPNKPATLFFGTELTYRELRKQVRRFANALTGLGIKQGDRVAIQLPNCPQYIIAYYAVLHLGAIVVNVNPLYTPDEIAFIIETTGATTLVTFSMVLPAVQQACEAQGLERVIVTSVTDYINGMPPSTKASLDLPDAWHHFSALLDECTNDRRPRVRVEPEDPALIMFTGGTTGVPKGAVHTHASVMAATFQFHAWPKGQGDFYPAERRTSLALMPFFHSAGNNVVLNPGILGCATLILVPRFEIDEFVNLLAGIDEIWYSLLVPTVITALVNHPKAPELKLDEKMKMLSSGAAPMPVELIEQVEDLGIKYSEGWGMTETASAGLANPLMGRKKTGTVGLPLPDIECRIVDLEDGAHEVPPGEPGELVVTGPRRRHPRRRLLFLHRRPEEGHDHRGRLQHLSARGRRGPAPAPQGAAGLCRRRPGRVPRRNRQGLRCAEARRDGHGTRDHGPLQGASRHV